MEWSFDIGPGGGGQEATPLFANAAIYGITNWSVVFAGDAKTGKEKWRWETEVNQTAVRPKICCGVVNRGIAIYQNLVIAPVIDGRLQAHDMESGRAVWEARVAYSQDEQTITMARRIAKPDWISANEARDYEEYRRAEADCCQALVAPITCSRASSTLRCWVVSDGKATLRQ